MPSEVLQLFGIKFTMLDITPILHHLLVRCLKIRLSTLMLQTGPSKGILSIGKGFTGLFGDIILGINGSIGSRCISQYEMTRTLIHLSLYIEVLFLNSKVILFFMRFNKLSYRLFGKCILYMGKIYTNE